jgi:predicted unusual protein kinase regulating ubiquinone biosynthesis (AarF/ABC1/UbiB family)
LDAEHLEADTQQLLIEFSEVGKRHGLRFPRAFTLLLKQFLYFDRYVRLIAPDLQPWVDQRLQLGGVN